MIISASRRTDIPALFGEWFLNRVKAGYCVVKNPFNPLKKKRVSLLPSDVEGFVFWTRNAAPFLMVIDELESRGYNYYFLYTLTAYPQYLEPGLKPVEERVADFKRTSLRAGKNRIIWRYDPIILSRHFDFRWHLDMFYNLSKELDGYTQCVIISFLDFYRKKEKILEEVEHRSGDLFERNILKLKGIGDFLDEIVNIAKGRGLKIQLCCEPHLNRGKLHCQPCIDNRLISSLINKNIQYEKDDGQRIECLCSKSIDIGSYNTCIHGCMYCYATVSVDQARKNYNKHNPEGETFG